MNLTLSDSGLALLKRLEGFRAEPMTLADGRVLVGYGHVQSSPPPAPLSEAEAEALLRADVAPVVTALNEKILTPVTQAQFDALVSFAFSIGVAAFARSDVLRRLNAGEPIAAACAMDAWRKSRVTGEPAVLDVLVRRRTAEKALFLEIDAITAASSNYVCAEVDHAAAILGQPTQVTSIPSEAPPAVSDSAARKIARILASEPATAHALRAPVASSPEEVASSPEEDDEPVLAPPANVARREPAPEASEVTGLALFGLAGAGLLAASLIAHGQQRPVLFLLFAAPGAVLLAGAARRLLGRRLSIRLPLGSRGAQRG